MSLHKIDPLENDQQLPRAKKGLTFEKYIQQLQQIDMSNIGAWPRSVKYTMYVFILMVILLVAYFVLVRGVQDNIASAEAQQQNLLNEFKDKNSKLRNLKQYQTQVQIMQGQFDQQLEQLPKQTEIPGLVEDINMAGVSSGLEFKNIQLLPEIKQEVFIEQPIDITVSGNYHNMGSFVSAIAALPRIVTLHDFKIDTANNEGKASEVPKLSMNIKAKTYRYMNEAEQAAQQEAQKNEKK